MMYEDREGEDAEDRERQERRCAGEGEQA